MKRLFPAVAVLLFLSAAAPVFALDTPESDARVERRDRTTVIDDVIRMTQAGVSDDAIIKFLHSSRDGYVVNADVIIALTNAHVSKPVLDAVMDGASMRDDDRGDRRDDRRDDGGGTRTAVYVSPYVGFDPWYPYYAYDPFWYAPRFSASFRFGGWGGYGGRYFGGWGRGGVSHGGGNHGGGSHGGSHGGGHGHH